MRHIVTARLVLVAIIHLLPISGVLGSERLAKLYGISLNEPNIVILMRHRAVLLGLLGLFWGFAAFRPIHQPAAFVTAFASVLSFLWLAWSGGSYNAQVGRVFAADIVALVCLIVGAATYSYSRRGG